MEAIVAERQGSDREVVAERSRKQNSDRRKTNWQRGRAWATSVLANAKSKVHPDTSGRARRRGVKVQALTRGDLWCESAGEVSRGHSSEDARRKLGRAKGRSIELKAQPKALHRGERLLEQNGAAITAASVDWQTEAEPVQPGRAKVGGAESRWRSQGHRKP